jgi:hypothetical protein
VIHDLDEKYRPGGIGEKQTTENFAARCNLDPIEEVREKVKLTIRQASPDIIDRLIIKFSQDYDFVAESTQDKRETLLEIVDQLNREELCKMNDSTWRVY